MPFLIASLSSLSLQGNARKSRISLGSHMCRFSATRPVRTVVCTMYRQCRSPTTPLSHSRGATREHTGSAIHIRRRSELRRPAQFTRGFRLLCRCCLDLSYDLVSHRLSRREPRRRGSVSSLAVGTTLPSSTPASFGAIAGSSRTPASYHDSTGLVSSIASCSSVSACSSNWQSEGEPSSLRRHSPKRLILCRERAEAATIGGSQLVYTMVVQERWRRASEPAKTRGSRTSPRWHQCPR